MTDIATPTSRIVSVEVLNGDRPASRFCVVIPTYNEEGNVREIIRAVDELAEPVDICVVDDGSPDRTVERVLEEAKMCKCRVFLIQRAGKFGLGSAYLDVFRWLITTQDYDVFVQMDADFSHNPSYLPALVFGAKESGMAIGSRYVPGGSTPDWEGWRYVLSRFGNGYASMIFRVRHPDYPIEDSTAGFTAYRHDVLEYLLGQRVLGEGYAYQISMKYLAYLNGIHSKEIPVVFMERRNGVSKLSFNIILEAIVLPWKLLLTAGSRHSSHSKTRTILPYALFILTAFVLTIVPHILINRFAQGAGHWRVAYIGNTLFDTYTYLGWIGSYLSGWRDTTSLGFLNPIFKVLDIGHISVPEMWLATRFLALSATFFVLWVYFKKKIPRYAMLFTVLCCTFPFALFSFRPGAYSWYMPLAFLGFWANEAVFKHLSKRAWGRAVLWSILSLACCSAYPWFFLVEIIWLMGLWVPILVKFLSRFKIILLWAGLIFMAIGTAVIGTRIFTPVMLEYYIRTGLSFSRLPVFTNALIAIFGWIALSILAIFSSGPDHKPKLFVFLAGWLAILAAWFHTVFTGIYTSNDHFRLPTFLLGIMMLPYLLDTSRNEISQRFLRRMTDIAPFFIALTSIAVLLRIVFFEGISLWSDHLQLVHVAIWVPLLAGALFSIRHPSIVALRRWIVIGLSTIWIVVGVVSFAKAIKIEYAYARSAVTMISLFSYVKSHEALSVIPACATPALAETVSAQTGQRVYPASYTSFLFEPHAALFRRLRILLQAHRPSDADEWKQFRTAYIGYRDVSCTQFDSAIRAFSFFGIPESRMRALTFCPRAEIEREWAALTHAVEVESNASEFRSVCPIVYISVQDRQRWSVPSDYIERLFGDYIMLSDPSVVRP